MGSWTRRAYEMVRYSFIGEAAKRGRLNRFRRQWRKLNQENQTIPNNVFDLSIVKVGRATYGELNVISYGHSDSIQIGSYCSIAGDVHFIINAGHRMDTLSTYPFRVKLLKLTESEAVADGDIIIGDDVWIGYGATILSGVRIGQGSVIGAGAVVTKDVPAYSIVAGVPAKVVRNRFSPEVIKVIENVNFNSLRRETVLSNGEKLYKQIESPEDAEMVLSVLFGNLEINANDQCCDTCS